MALEESQTALASAEIGLSTGVEAPFHIGTSIRLLALERCAGRDVDDDPSFTIKPRSALRVIISKHTEAQPVTGLLHLLHPRGRKQSKAMTGEPLLANSLPRRATDRLGVRL